MHAHQQHSIDERRLRFAFDRSTDAMAFLDQRGRVLEVNAAACAVLGGPRADLVGRVLWDFAEPSSAEDALDARRRWEQRHGDVSTQLRIDALDGVGRMVDVHVGPIEVPGGYGAEGLCHLRVMPTRSHAELALRRALQRRELVVWYQPEVSFRTGKVTSVEALIRWEHPTDGLIFPGDFIPLAEATGLVVPIGWWVLDEACRQAQQWRNTCGPNGDVTVRVNLSARQLAEADAVERVAQVLAETGCPPEMLCLEVTESMLLADPVEAQRQLSALRSLGVELAIDDFGTGYSSLKYLKQLPVQILKIDKSFVDGLLLDPQDRAIVAAVIHLALAIGMEVTAEGVELPEQMFELQRLGCRRGQGYLFGKAAPAPEITSLFGADLVEAATL